MKINELEKIENRKYIVLLPKKDYDIKESVEYSFENVLYLDYEINKKDLKRLIKYINENLEQLILFSFDELFKFIIPFLKPTIKIKWVYRHSFAAITSWRIDEEFNNIIDFYNRDAIDEIVCLNRGVYEVLKNSGYNASYIILDLENKKSKIKKSNSIGIIGNDHNPNHNIYNELSAVKMLKYGYIKINPTESITKHFLEFFNIKYECYGTLEEIMSDNEINLYCNFTCNNFQLILKSMDKGIPCIVGNTDFFDDNKYLKTQLVLSSDDNINEIAEKINSVKENKEKILTEYAKFRVKYSKESKKQIKDLLK